MRREYTLTRYIDIAAKFQQKARKKTSWPGKKHSVGMGYRGDGISLTRQEEKK